MTLLYIGQILAPKAVLAGQGGKGDKKLSKEKRVAKEGKMLAKGKRVAKEARKEGRVAKEARSWQSNAARQAKLPLGSNAAGQSMASCQQCCRLLGSPSPLSELLRVQKFVQE